MSRTIHWTVPADHPTLAGHFPAMPILPGVVLLDLVLQIIADSRIVTLESCTLNSVKFLSPAAPGESLSISHEQTTADTIHFEIHANTRKIAAGSLQFNSPP